MKTYFLALLFIFEIATFSYGQIPIDYQLRETMDLYNKNKFITESGKYTLTEKDISGSPYLNDEFENGSIYTVQRLKYIDVPLRYNIYNDNLEFKNPENEIMALAAPEIVEKAVIGNTILAYSPFLQAGKTKKGFFVVLEEGKATLYAKPGVVFREATEPGAYKEAEPAKFLKRSDEYYIRIGTGEAQIIGNKKDMIAAFPDNRDKVESFISKNKIKLNKPESLKELFKYYNSL